LFNLYYLSIFFEKAYEFLINYTNVDHFSHVMRDMSSTKNVKLDLNTATLT